MTREGSTPGERPLLRQRVAEQVFDSLVQAILKGELAPGDAIGTQRDLAERYGVSPLLVRQAIHRLEELGLVRVRQGSATIVLDPNASTDIRVLQLRVETAAADTRMIAAIMEVQTLGALPQLALAERCLTELELEQLHALVETVQDDATPEQLHQFVVEYWRMIVQATRNPFMQHWQRWWWQLAEDQRAQGRKLPLPSQAPAVKRDYLNITRALAARQGAVQVYLKALEPMLTWLDFARPIAPAPVKPQPSAEPKK